MAVKFKDYYETLGVPRTATSAEIKKAYRKLALVHHPDVAKDKVAGEEKFREINEAYQVLSDPEKRKRFDELGAQWEDPGFGAAPGAGAGQAYGQAGGEEGFEFNGTGFSDFFEQYFAGRRDGFGASQGHGRPGAPPGEGYKQRGHDVEADILVTLEEALRGSQRKVSLRRPASPGAAERQDAYNVRIPKGVHEGQLIRLGGQGGAGHGGGAQGDLYLRVRLARHPDFRVQDADLYYDLDLAPWEAVLGVQVKVPALDGPTSLKVPAGTNSGSQLRMRGLGLPKEDGTRGDLYATLRVQTPESSTDEEKELWEKLAAISKFKPRSEP